MKLVILGAVLLLLSPASLVDAQPGGTAPQTTSGATSGAKAPSDGDGSQRRSEAKGTGSSCRKASSGTCKGCSITCAEGEKAVCSEALYNWNADKCTRDATCRCKATRSRN